MKCQHCGGEVDSHAVRCPYCNRENIEGMHFQEEVQKKLERYKILKPFIIKQKTPEMVSQYMTRLLLILIGVNVLLIGVSFLIFVLGEKLVQTAVPPKNSYAEKFTEYQEGTFYAEMNQFVEKHENGEMPTEYEFEELIEDGRRTLNMAKESEVDVFLITTFLMEYMGLTEEEMNYLKEYPTENYYLDDEWIAATVERVKKEMEGNER